MYKAIKYLHRTADLKTFNSLDFWDNRTAENISVEVSLYLGIIEYIYILSGIFYQRERERETRK